MKTKAKSSLEDNKSRIIKTTIAFVFPIAICFLYCVLHGETLFDLYAPNSDNNDSLFYFKIAESMINSNGPRGYFGYNEEAAVIGVGGYWSPVLYLPWVVFGIVFGWGVKSVFIYNLIIISGAFATFIYLTNPSIEKCISMVVLLALFPSFPAYIMSVLPEIIILAVLLVFFGAVINEYEKGEEWIKQRYFLMYACVLYLTLARPYMSILMIFPCASLLKRGIKKAVIINIGLFLLFIGLYFIVFHFFSTPYYHSFSLAETIKLIVKGEKEFAIQKTKSTYQVLWVWISSSLRKSILDGYAVGIQYVVAFISMIFVLVSSFFEKKKDLKICFRIYSLIYTIVILANFLLMPKAFEIGRHLFSFAVIGCLLLCLSSEGIKITVFKTLIASYLITCLLRGSINGAEYAVPYFDKDLAHIEEYWENAFEAGLKDDKGGYNKTLIWVDEFGTENMHKELYALPIGMGINYCYSDYVINNWDGLKSRYIATATGSEIDKMCKKSQHREIGRTDDVVIYAMY